MRCTKCGAEISAGKISCDYCGALINNPNNNMQFNQNGNIPQNNYNYKDYYGNKRNGNKSKLIITIVVILLIIGGVGLSIYFSSKDGSNNEDITDDNSNNNKGNSSGYSNYVQNLRKSVFIDTASAYIDAVRIKVKEARKLKLFTPKILYLIPVGVDDSKSCAFIESGGKSPFSNKWNYAFVGVIYKDGGVGYEYYFIGEDGANNGIGLVEQHDLENEKIYSSYNDSSAKKYFITKTVSNNLEKMYNLSGNTTYSDIEGTPYLEGIKEALSNTNYEITKTIVISASTGCAS